MADQRLIAGMKRFLTTEQIRSNYEAIFNAYFQRLSEVTVITGKSTEGESAQAQVVVNREDYLEYMEALEQILTEIEGTATAGPVHVSHMNRYTTT